MWCGEDELLQRPVAIKEILVPMAGAQNERDAIRARVLREARALARLHSPAIVSVYDVVEEHERHWIIMELVDADSLGDVIKNHGPLPFDQVAAIGLALADALAAAHSAGVLHRDVKPGNVLLGRDGRVRLTDFGIAATEGDVTLTGTGALVGSPAYIAPERVRGSSGSPASDLWGLGATLYSAVEGSPPFEGPETYAVLSAVVEGRRRPFRLAGPLRGLLTDLLDRPAEQRPDVEEIRRRLTPIARNATPVPASVTHGHSRGRPVDQGENDGSASDDGLENLAAPEPPAPPTRADEPFEPAAAGIEARQARDAPPGIRSAPADRPVDDEDQTAIAPPVSGLAALGLAASDDESIDEPADETLVGRREGGHDDVTQIGRGTHDDVTQIGGATQIGAGGADAFDLDDANMAAGLVPLDHEAAARAASPHRRAGASHRGEQRGRSRPRARTLAILAGAAATAVVGAAVALALTLTAGGDADPGGSTAEGPTPTPTVIVTIAPVQTSEPTPTDPVETAQAPTYTRPPRQTVAPAVPEPPVEETQPPPEETQPPDPEPTASLPTTSPTTSTQPSPSPDDPSSSPSPSPSASLPIGLTSFRRSL